MKIVLVEPLDIPQETLASYKADLEELGHELITYEDRAQDPQTLLHRCQDAQILMLANQELPDSVIEAAKDLQYINIAFTGYNHVNVALAKEKGILVSNASGYATSAVAELVIGLTLSCYRMLAQSDKQTRQGKSLADYYTGYEIKGKTVGIIGTGTIGQACAKLFLAFGAKVIAYSRTKRQDLIEAGVQYQKLDDLLKTADIVSVHLALNEATKQLLDRDKLSLMKKDALLINCARGPIIDNQALADLLNQGHIGAAAIDVFDSEPPLNADEPLLKAKNTLVTPHIGYHTQEAMLKRAAIVFDNVHAFLQGRPQNVVND